MAASTGCPSPLDPDSDGDLLSDGTEVGNGTDPCSPDTDGDGICDSVDSNPTTPDTSSGALEDSLLLLADQIDALPLSVIDAPNDNSARGRQNSLSNRVRNAARSVAASHNQAAANLLRSVLTRMDGQETDWLLPSAESTVVSGCIVDMIVLLE